MWRIAALIAALLFSLPATAQVEATQGTFVGYEYPAVGFGSLCSPTCTGASVSVNIPTSFTGSAIIFAWLGVDSVRGDGTICPSGGCLAQFGFEWTGSGVRPWYEVVCSGGTACGNVVPITGLTVNLGDTLNLSMTCTANCTGISSEIWTATIVDGTTGNTCFITTAAGSHCGSSGVTVNWPVSQNNQVLYVYENQGATTWAQPAAWALCTYTTGLPGSQTTHKCALTPGMASWTPGTGAGASKTMSPSAPLGLSHDAFNVCSPVTSATFNACAGGSYLNTTGVGP